MHTNHSQKHQPSNAHAGAKPGYPPMALIVNNRGRGISVGFHRRGRAAAPAGRGDPPPWGPPSDRSKGRGGWRAAPAFGGATPPGRLSPPGGRGIRPRPPPGGSPHPPPLKPGPGEGRSKGRRGGERGGRRRGRGVGGEGDRRERGKVGKRKTGPFF